MKKRLAQLAAVAVCVVMVGSLAACGGNTSSNSSSGDSSDDTITVGVVYPATGALAAFGDGTEEMYGYAVDQINEAGGVEVDGSMKKIELVFADSQSDATKASEAANNLIL